MRRGGRLAVAKSAALFVVAVLVALDIASAAIARSGPVELGAAVNNGGLFSDPDSRYRDTLWNYDAITAESAMKILELQPQQDQFEFATADAIVAFAAAGGQKVHGHTLAWCEDTWLPDWLKNRSWTRAQLLTVLQKHITTVLTHFKGRISSWDVVNEAFNADGTVRDCLWSRVIGDDWVEQALRFAHAADPNVKLFYNEIRADVPNPRFEAVLAMVQDFRARGVPIDGVGLQMHLTTDAPPQDQIETAISRLGALGLDVHISEMDVPTWYLGPTIEEKLARQAESYRRVAAACQAQPACFRITTWGFTDRYTWRGTSSMPLPFDSEYVAKPAWTALQEVLRPPASQPSPPPPPAPEPVPVARRAANPLAVAARVRRKRLATWLGLRRIPVLVTLRGDVPAHIVAIARLHGRTFAIAEEDLSPDRTTTIRLRLSARDRRLLRRARGSLVKINVTAAAPDGERSQVRTRALLR
jgi:endo-1,4-beta-xylanase